MGVYEDMANDAGYPYRSDENRRMADALQCQEQIEWERYQEERQLEEAMSNQQLFEDNQKMAARIKELEVENGRLVHERYWYREKHVEARSTLVQVQGLASELASLEVKGEYDSGFYRAAKILLDALAKRKGGGDETL
jgi:hypothetical protein